MNMPSRLVDLLKRGVRKLPFWSRVRRGILGGSDASPNVTPASIETSMEPVATQASSLPVVTPQADPGHRPLISGSNPLYLSSISIKGDDSPFQIIDPVSVKRTGDVHTDIHSFLSPSEVDACVSKDTYPLPATVDREGYHGDRHFDWWLSGLRDFLAIQRKLREHGSVLSGGDAVLDLGCASGRLLRHFSIQGDNLDCWGADIKLRNVEWMRLFLPSDIKIFHNTVLPHLSMEDNSMALVTAFSVFTHIDDLELAWMAEIRRVLKPGGYFYVTIHSQETWASMKPGISVYDALMHMSAHIHDYQVTEQFLAGPMPRPKTVLTWDTGQSYNSNVFHHTDYIKREWGRFFDVVEIIPRGSVYQDVVLLRKPVRP